MAQNVLTDSTTRKREGKRMRREREGRGREGGRGIKRERNLTPKAITKPTVKKTKENYPF